VHALEYLLKPLSEKELTTNLEEAIYLTQKSEKKKPLLKGDLQENHHENIKMNAVADNIREFIEKHYKEDISLQDVAGSMNYSDAYFCKIFKQCFDKSFLVYLTEYRVEKAKVLLADMSINIKDVSAEVGYRDSNYFARVFKRNEGITPTEYRLRVLHTKKGE
jgi:YesN/AraC family two-component response regulator